MKKAKRILITSFIEESFTMRYSERVVSTWTTSPALADISSTETNADGKPDDPLHNEAISSAEEFWHGPASDDADIRQTRSIQRGLK